MTNKRKSFIRTYRNSSYFLNKYINLLKKKPSCLMIPVHTRKIEQVAHVENLIPKK